MIQRGDALTAAVWGSQPEPYRVVVRLDSAGVADADCDCPYDWGGWCKHIVAVLLFATREPEQIQERPTIDAMLAGLGPEQLRAVLLGLARHDPRLVEEIESQVTQLEVIPMDPATPSAGVAASTLTSAPTHRPRSAPLDDKPFRRAVQAALHSADRLSGTEAYYAVSGILDEVRSVLDKAREFTRAGDARSALAILGAITDEFKEAWESLDDSDGEVADFFGELGEVWTEALLGADLAPGERAEWHDRLDEWQADVGEYGVDECFAAALAAAEQGWDYPPLLRILRGEPVVGETLDVADHEALFDPDLIAVRLDILERQGRHEGFLRLAEAAGATTRYATMLVSLGRSAEAAEYALRRVNTPQEALIVAKALRDGNELVSALRVAERGLTLDGPESSGGGAVLIPARGKAELAAWTRDLAAALGEGELALAAALAAFRAEPSLTAYLRTRELAGESWSQTRAELLDFLRSSVGYSIGGHVDVFLYEGLIGDAITAVERSYDGALIQRVVTTPSPEGDGFSGYECGIPLR